MQKTFSSTYLFILLGSLALLGVLFSGCRQPSKPNPQTSQAIRSQPSLVEHQLLATIKNAEKLEQGNPLLLSSLYSLANYYHDRKEYDKAAHQYQRALTIKEEISGPDHPDIAEILRCYARVLQEAQRPTEAASLLARADAILARSTPPPLAQ